MGFLKKLQPFLTEEGLISLRVFSDGRGTRFVSPAERPEFRPSMLMTTAHATMLVTTSGAAT
jgi:hypothetical protein